MSDKHTSPSIKRISATFLPCTTRILYNKAFVLQILGEYSGINSSNSYKCEHCKHSSINKHISHIFHMKNVYFCTKTIDKEIL